VTPDDEKKVRQAIKSFIFASVNVPGLGDEEDLFESGIVNSLFAVQLMTYLEKTFDIEVTADDIDIDNLKSISACAAFVIRKKGLIAA
jgi:methoxymalonate biosynthesis acyl carrier protein